MKQRNQLFGYIVLIAGLALIFAGFFHFVPQEKRNDVFWLDLSVACLVFIVTTFTELGLFGINFDFLKNKLWTWNSACIHSYVFIPCHCNNYYRLLSRSAFSLPTFLSTRCCFPVAVRLFLFSFKFRQSRVSSGRTRHERKGKDQILNAISQFEILITTNTAKFGAEKQKLTPSKKPFAICHQQIINRQATLIQKLQTRYSKHIPLQK